jgi:5-hydroxyisourate hydrolase-like protein (transthyretin family)
MIARAAVDMDVSGGEGAVASNGEESISTDGGSFCSISDDIAGSKFSSLFKGIVDCDNDSQVPNQFFVEYSYTKDPVKIGEKTYLTVTVKDKSSGNPISDAFVKLAIQPSSPSSGANTISTALAAARISTQEVVEDKTTQSIYTDNNGRATFTVQLGPKSDVGVYDTEIEVRKDNYQSNFQQTDLRVV